MPLFSATEYAVISIGRSGHLRGCRLRCRRQGLLLVRAAELPPEDGELAERIGRLHRKLEISKEHILIVGGNPDGGFFFRCRTPGMSARELATSLVFDAQEHLLQLPPEPRIQFSTRPADDETDDLEVNAWVFPTGALSDIGTAFAKRRFRIDEFIHPLVALPALPAGARVRLPELDADFYWQDDSFHPPPSQPQSYNEELVALLKKDVAVGDSCDVSDADVWSNFLTPVMMGVFASRPDFRRQRAGLAVLPEFLRPQRHRNHLRIAVVLALVLAGEFAFAGGGAMLKFGKEYGAIVSRTRSLNAKTETSRQRLRSRDKDLKEMTRIVDLNLGERELLRNMARLSEAMPPKALVTSLRWSEQGADLALQSSEDNLDIAAPLRKLTGFKVANVQQRKLNDTVTSVTLKLNRVDGGAK